MTDDEEKEFDALVEKLNSMDKEDRFITKWILIGFPLCHDAEDY